MINGSLDVLWGTNGYIWIQRSIKQGQQHDDTSMELAQLQEKLRQEHAQTPILLEERQALSRLKNAIECLRLVHCMVTPESAEAIYNQSLQQEMRPADMLLPDNVIQLTESSRNSKQ